MFNVMFLAKKSCDLLLAKAGDVSEQGIPVKWRLYKPWDVWLTHFQADRYFVKP